VLYFRVEQLSDLAGFNMYVSGANLMVTEANVSQKLSHAPLLQCVCVRLL
jgi:hypothetical protein